MLFELLLAVYFFFQSAFRSLSISSGRVQSLLSGGYSNDPDDPDRMVLVLSAPQSDDEYYKPHFKAIYEFHVNYAKSALGKDNIVIIGQWDVLAEHYRPHLPDEILLAEDGYPMDDVWMRDFTTVVPKTNVEFSYDRTGEDGKVQPRFNAFVNKYGVFRRRYEDLKVDGGNVVDNNKDKAILTKKVYQRNNGKSEKEVREALKSAMGLKEVAIIDMDDEYLGHSDGIVMWTNETHVLVDESANATQVSSQLTNITTAEIKNNWEGGSHGKYASACGLYVNSVVTNKYIYVPTFRNTEFDNYAADRIRSFTNKTVVPVDSKGICFLGGNVRCLTWQLQGDPMKTMVMAARNSGALVALAWGVVMVLLLL